jgi:hypothetical protein
LSTVWSKSARACLVADKTGDSDEYETDTDDEEDKLDVITEGDEEEAEEEEQQEEEEPAQEPPPPFQRPPPPGPKPTTEKPPKSPKEEKKPKAKKKVVADSPPWSMEVAPSADEIRADLQEMRLRPLKKRALAAGVTYEQLDEAEDEEDYHGAIIELVVTKETALASAGTKVVVQRGHKLSALDPNAIRAELLQLKLKELKKRCASWTRVHSLLYISSCSLINSP